MDREGRYTHIEDVLVALHSGQWFGWSDASNKVYANLIIHDESKSKPTEKELTDALKKQQDDFDALDYSRKREAEYPSIKELVVALYDTDDKSAIETKRAEIKKKYPKPE
tara:strand:+ start:692 stop:1021 length:330 start_codon:yes stop_codon:yes gene_type:complete